jgi:hypothetical protein
MKGGAKRCMGMGFREMLNEAGGMTFAQTRIHKRNRQRCREGKRYSSM